MPDERKQLLLRLLRDARVRKSLSLHEGENIIEHVCLLRGFLDAGILKEVGIALGKVEVIPSTEADWPT